MSNDDMLGVLRIGTELSGNRYVIEAVLGRGGFGCTYEAYDRIRNKKCAVKEYFPRKASVRLPDGLTVRPSSAERKEFYEHWMIRFREEAATLWRLQGTKSVVQVYDYFVQNATSYFVMEYIEGATLSALVQAGGRLDMSTVRNVFSGVGMAVLQIHAHGMLHRDIKPDNIMIRSEDGEGVILDFGNAREAKRDELTVVLTPGFAPKEQEYKEAAYQGPWTDVYSFASTMYYAMTGERLPSVNSRMATTEYVPLSEMGFDKNIAVAMNKALRIDYRDRTKNIYDFMSELGWLNTAGATVIRNVHSASNGIADIGNGQSYQTSNVYRDNRQYQQNYNYNYQQSQSGMSNLGRRLESHSEERDELFHSYNAGYNNRVSDVYSSNWTAPMMPVASPGERVPCPYMYIISGDGAGSRLELPYDRGVVIGRTEGFANIVCVKDVGISRRHCEVYYDSRMNKVIITDFSMNGTWVNGSRLDKYAHYPVEDGSVVELANKICSFKVGVRYQ